MKKEEIKKYVAARKQNNTSCTSETEEDWSLHISYGDIE